MNKLKQTLEKVLKSEATFFDSESGELNYIKVKDSADSINEKLITLLASNKELKDKFFTKIKDVYVFNIQGFKFFLDESKVDNSYTQYANKIGLADNSGLLENRSEVVLDFPFKDCVLEGGQSTEEGTDTYFEHSEKTGKYEEKNGKRNEVFFNQVLAHDEIDRLFDRKVLVNWKRFTKDSKKDGEAVKEIKRDKTGLIQENLIIKGNNLLALHSLKSEFAGKIKLIYIDPPYNTGNDGFQYNDNFNHSTWLTFMKNRLEIAKELLRDDGAIFVQCDDSEQAYLKVLMDGIFGRENFVNTVIMKTINPNGIKTTHANRTILKVKEQILVYKKNTIEFYPQYSPAKEYDGYYNLFIEGDLENLEKCKVIKLDEKLKSLKLEPNLKDKKFKEFVITNAERIFQTKFDKRVQTDERYKDGGLYVYQDNPNYWVYQKRFGLKLSKIVKEIFGEKELGVLLGDVWDDFRLNNLYLEGEVDFSNAKKPEHLISRILNLATQEGDIVLDFQLGSGTTSAVAHKMNRQYIGVEQMDYLETIAVERMKKVLQGEQGGVSKAVNWQGGGDFIYCELAKWNEQAKEEIQNAKDLPALVKLFDTLYEKYFLNYNVKIKDFKDKIIKEENFKKLTLAQQKKMFLTMLDLNQMYVQESEMADKKYGISSEDQKLTKAFYSKK